MKNSRALAELEGRVIVGNRVGRTLGVPTANIAYDPEKKCLPDGVYVHDERTGKVWPVQHATEDGTAYVVATIPLDPDSPHGRYRYLVTAIDEEGNLRQWSSHYRIGPEQHP